MGRYERKSERINGIFYILKDQNGFFEILYHIKSIYSTQNERPRPVDVDSSLFYTAPLTCSTPMMFQREIY